MLSRLLKRPRPETQEASIDAGLLDSQMTGWFRHETGELLKGFAVTADDVVLDIGCGEGQFARFCADQGAEIILADIQEEKIERARQRVEGGRAKAITALVTDADPLPLEDGRASKIIAMEVLEHVDDPQAFVRELVRVGKPGAQYLISVPGTYSEEIQKSLAPESYFEKPNHIRIFSPEEFEQLLVENGLEIEGKANYGFYWSIWWFFFWTCNQDLSPPWHPLLKSWENTWALLLASPQGEKVKRVLDDHMPKSQAIIARKPSN
ncbi:class I SAM-dependent methyltransferase [Pseudomonas nitroreducens]|uniref:class I SAM-dependent methyltransferase n=1 Tax=Pseudomonas nitroreducens TaxID=46680 RepID=UPI002D7E6AF8|nr:class I SAM-dependent methyltransferase [Pseudomonas nitroreducens]